MVFFKYLANILQHSSLNCCFHKDSENKTSNIYLLIFAGFYCSYGDISVKILLFWRLEMKIWALKISFQNRTANEKKIELRKEVLEYSWPNYVNIPCPKTWKFCVCITKRDLNHMPKKKTFLRCEVLRVFWDLNTPLWVFFVFFKLCKMVSHRAKRLIWIQKRI